MLNRKQILARIGKFPRLQEMTDENDPATYAMQNTSSALSNTAAMNHVEAFPESLIVSSQIPQSGYNE